MGSKLCGKKTIKIFNVFEIIMSFNYDHFENFNFTYVSKYTQNHEGPTEMLRFATTTTSEFSKSLPGLVETSLNSAEGECLFDPG